MNSILLHVVLPLLLIKLSLLLCSCILVLLIFGHKVIHVALSLSELHFVHALARVPVQKSLAAEHGGEELRDAFEHLLNSCRIASKGHGHLQPLRGNVTDACLDVIWNPLHEIARVLVLDIQHLFINLLGRHAASEKRGGRQIPTMARVSCAHHILGIEHLLCQLWHCQSTILLRSTRSQWCKSSHKEMEAREWNEVDSNLPEIAIELSGKAQARGHTTHGFTDEVIQIAVSGSGQLQCPE